jgi:transposase
VPPDLEVHLVMDNYATHKTALIHAWLARRPRWHVHLTPTSSSWLNQFERFFAHLLRIGCQWRLLRCEFPPRNTVYHYFSVWRTRSVWTKLQWALHKRARVSADRAECPNAVIVDGQSVKTTERGGLRGFEGHKRVKGRKRQSGQLALAYQICLDLPGRPFYSAVGK